MVVEPDAGGEAVCKWLSQAAFRNRVHIIDLGDAKDPSQLYLSDTEKFQEAWQAAMKAAILWADLEKRKAEEQKREEWENCKALAQESNILDRFANDVAASGVVGEERLVKLIYLAVTSRVLDRPVSLAIKGTSSAGKSFVVEKVLEFYPPSAYYALTAMSERSLAYSDEPLSHRMLVIFENAGIQGEFGTYLMRSLLSEGRIRYETVESTSEGLKPKLIERQGPTGLIVTTTKINLHPENETRLLTLNVTDTPEQTKHIMMALASGQTCEPDFDQWRALQKFIEFSDNRVVIPFAKSLADFIPPVAVRLRRDFGVLLRLIRAHAVLNQANRERDDAGWIVATNIDYEVVRELVTDILSEGVESSVSKTIRETVSAVENLSMVSEGGATYVAVTKELGLDRSAGYRRALAALKHGYLKNLEDKRSHPAKLVVGDPLPDDINLLPPVEVLQDCTVAVESEGGVPPSPNYAGAPEAQDKDYKEEDLPPKCCTVAVESEGVLSSLSSSDDGNLEIQNTDAQEKVLPPNRCLWPEDWQKAYAERVCMMVEGGLAKEDAELRAEDSIRRAFEESQKVSGTY